MLVDVSCYGVVHITCFDGMFVFTDAVLQSVCSATHTEAPTAAGEAVDNMSGVAVDEVIVLVGVVHFQICECVGTYNVRNHGQNAPQSDILKTVSRGTCTQTPQGNFGSTLPPRHLQKFSHELVEIFLTNNHAVRTPLKHVLRGTTYSQAQHTSCLSCKRKGQRG